MPGDAPKNNVARLLRKCCILFSFDAFVDVFCCMA